MRAKKFVQAHETDIGKEMRDKAAGVLEDLRGLAKDIKSCYLGHGNSDGSKLFARLAKYFDGDALESITSYELLTSGIVEVLLDVFTAPDTQASSEARSAFLQVFMGTHLQSDFVGSDGTTNTTPFSVLVHKLQDLLSRSEHFEVITVHQNSFDSNRSSAASMLAKQLRIKLFADEESGIPKPYRNIMVSIHAIATFKALDDYLRPRISLAERPRTARHREGMSGAIAAYAAAMSGRGETE
ncbi:Ubiquitin fusion degradation protein 4, partial [Cryomyces antarcticus]